MNTNRKDLPIELPKKIHFIWVGGAIPEKYLRSIQKLADIAKRSGFEINLWVDNEMNYQKTSTQANIQIPNLRIRMIDELQEKMRADPFYQGDEGEDRLKQFNYCVRREMVGFKNLAAASDFLRYEILRQEGGYYFDTDTEFKVDSSSRLTPDRPVLGIKGNFETHWDRNMDNSINIKELGGNNDIIVALPNHHVLHEAIISSIANYRKLDNEEYSSWRQSAFGEKDIKLKGAKMMDAKRYPFGENKAGFVLNRRNLTIQAAGPRVFCDVVKRYWEGQNNHSVAALDSLRINCGNRSEFELAGIKVTSHSDQTWLKKPASSEVTARSKRPSYDTSSISDTLFSAAPKSAENRSSPDETSKDKTAKDKTTKGKGPGLS